MRILLIRHAEPDYINDSITEKGKREARLLSDRIARYNIRDFYVSPLGRARDTAEYTLQNEKQKSSAGFRSSGGSIRIRKPENFAWHGIFHRKSGRNIREYMISGHS